MAVVEPAARRQGGAHGRHEHHRDVQGGAARAAVFGVSDGLLTNVSLILGVAGANPAPGVVRLAGLAGLVAGACSMAAGEYVSMTAQAELFNAELDVERRELERHPAAELRELAGVYRRRGLSREDAERIAAVLMRDPETALEVHAREELGVAPDETGSPPKAAASSFASFAGGALVPLIPWFFTSGALAVTLSIVLGALAAFGVGWALAVFTRRSRLGSAARQLGIAVAVAAVTYGIGALVGVRAT